MSITDDHIVRTFHVTIPEDASICGGVLDDVDDDGRHYNRVIEGPTVVYLDEFVDPYDGQPCWIVRDEALSLTDGNAEDLLADVDGEGIVAVEIAAGQER